MLLWGFRERLVTQFDIHGKVIGTERGKFLQGHKTKVGRMKDVIQWPSQQRVVGIEGIVHAPADAGIEEPADLLEV